MHYYLKNIGDYHKKAGRLSMIEHGAYTLLMDACYDREEFPTKEQALDWCWARTPEEIAAVEFVLNKFFTIVDGAYEQKRIREELDDYREKAEKNRIIAIEREEKKREKKSKPEQDRAPDKQAPARVVLDSCELKQELDVNQPKTAPNHKPVTSNHKPVTSNQEPAELLSVTQRYAAAADEIKKLGKISAEEFFENFSEWCEFVIFKRPDLAGEAKDLKPIFLIYAHDTGAGLRDDWFERWEDWILRER